jgi:hydrogenase large subunit
MSEAPRRLIVGPFNRVEGDLEIRLDIAAGQVRAAYANSPLFRGFERIMDGKDPRDALTIVPRICGICSVSQSMAAARALASAQGVKPPLNGELAAAVIHAAENVADHLTHFHVFFMADFARPIYADRPWHAETLRLFQAQRGLAVRAAVEARAQLLHVMGLLAGKWPHTLSIQPGGVTKAPDSRDRMRLLAVIRSLRQWLEANLFGDALEAFTALASADQLEAWRRQAPGCGYARLFLAIANDLGLGELGKGPPRFLSYGAYETANGFLFAPGFRDGALSGSVDTTLITEDLSHAWMLGSTAHPLKGQTVPDEDMRDGYSWCKAPRLGGKTLETGAFARQLVAGHPLAASLLSEARANVRARVVGRLLEIALTVPAMEQWVKDFVTGEPFIARGKMPDDAEAEGLTEAARGALGHWMVISKGRIASYQIIAPTTWNFSPRDADGAAGPVEEALVGAPVRPEEKTPVSVQHIVRSFDPCMVCTVH